MAEQELTPPAVPAETTLTNVPEQATDQAPTAAPTIWDFARYFLWLGTTGFGGPVALVGEMRRDLMEQRGWVSEHDFVEAVAFILPPFLLVTAIAALYVAFEGLTWMQAVFYGIGPAAVALILLSMWGLMKLVLRDRKGTSIFLVCAVITMALRA